MYVRRAQVPNPVMSVALKSLRFSSFFSLSCRMRRAMSGASSKVARNFTSWFVAQVTSKKSPPARRYLRPIRWNLNDLKSASALKLRKRCPKRQAALLRGRLSLQKFDHGAGRNGQTVGRRPQERGPFGLDPDEVAGIVVQTGTRESSPGEGGGMDPSLGIVQDPSLAHVIPIAAGIAHVEDLIPDSGPGLDPNRRQGPGRDREQGQICAIATPQHPGDLPVHPDVLRALHHMPVGEHQSGTDGNPRPDPDLRFDPNGPQLRLLDRMVEQGRREEKKTPREREDRSPHRKLLPSRHLVPL